MENKESSIQIYKISIKKIVIGDAEKNDQRLHIIGRDGVIVWCI
jgi:hypothetical protein